MILKNWDLHSFSSYWAISRMGRVFAKDPGDRGSIPGRIIPKTQKFYWMPPSLRLTIVRYGSRIMWRNPGKNVAPASTPRCSSYWKGSLRVANFTLLISSQNHNDTTEFLDSLTIHLYYPSFVTGLINCIQCPHRGDPCKFLLVG